MKCVTSSSYLARRSPLRAWIARTFALVILPASALIPAACGESGTTGIDNPIRPDTSTLAGTWKGSVNGSGGYALLTTQLNADSTFSGQGDTSFYCLVTGTWTVAAGKYTSAGRNCIGNVVTSVATASSLRLTGTWSTNDGKSGTFTLDKQ